MAISTIPFHPLDAENNPRYKVKKKDAPKIVWHETEETGAHDWEGYIRIPFDKECAFTIQMDDNCYLEIDNQKVVELNGSNSSKNSFLKWMVLTWNFGKLMLPRISGRWRMPKNC